MRKPFGTGHKPVSDRSTNRFPHRSTNRFPHRFTNRFPHRSTNRFLHRSTNQFLHRSTNRFPHRSTNRFPIVPRTIWEGFGAVEVFAKIEEVGGGGPGGVKFVFSEKASALIPFNSNMIQRIMLI